jgi:hypothetical protein
LVIDGLRIMRVFTPMVEVESDKSLEMSRGSMTTVYASAGTTFIVNCWLQVLVGMSLTYL